MKYSKMLARLEAKKRWYDAQSEAYKRCCKRPGSIKKR